MTRAMAQTKVLGKGEEALDKVMSTNWWPKDPVSVVKDIVSLTNL